MALATDFSDTAWVQSQEVPTQTVDNGEATLRAHRVNSHYEIDVVARSGSWIVISETSWPGWKAYVDDQRVKTGRANHAFLSVYVPKGRHHVRLVYLPDPFVRGRAISLGTLFFLGAGFGIRRWRRRLDPRD